MSRPIIIIPEDVTDSNCLHMIVDTGHIAITSEMADKAALKEVRDRAAQKYTETDWQRLEGLMYDKFHIQLDATQVCPSFW